MKSGIVRRRLAAILVCAIALVSSGCADNTPASAETPNHVLILGTFKQGACIDCDLELGPNGTDSYAKWLGSASVLYGEDNLGNSHWEFFEKGWPDSFRQWAEWKSSNAERRLVLAVPLWAEEEPGSNAERISRCASGEFDDHYRTFARNLREANLGDSVLRIAWEAHGHWNPWSYRNNPADWRNCWRRLAKTVKAEAPDVRTNWNVGDDSGGLRPDMRYSINLRGFDNFYPGDDVVDEIGIDSYASPPITDYDAYFGNDVGSLGWFVQLAATHGKRLSFPEWGLWDNRTTTLDKGSRDDPVYIERMYKWMTDPNHRVAWAAYFDINVDDNIVHQLQPDWQDGTVFPQASAKFKELFGSLP